MPVCNIRVYKASKVSPVSKKTVDMCQCFFLRSCFIQRSMKLSKLHSFFFSLWKVGISKVVHPSMWQSVVSVGPTSSGRARSQGSLRRGRQLSWPLSWTGRKDPRLGLIRVGSPRPFLTSGPVRWLFIWVNVVHPPSTEILDYTSSEVKKQIDIVTHSHWQKLPALKFISTKEVTVCCGLSPQTMY